MTRPLKIGGASGFWGEAQHATAQLLRVPDLDVLVYDYLAEVTMSIMARARIKDADKGYASDFVSDAMGRNLSAIAAKGVKVLSNAGGVNPVACGKALRAKIAEAGLSLSVAVVEGDDLLPRAAEFAGEAEMFSEAPMPPVDKLASMNAYIGAAPIVAALRAGADIVITGRCVDSALTLAACMHHYGWQAGDHDLLAAGSLAGHLLECGPQVTGGNFTDWEQSGDIAKIGYPVAEVADDGSMILTKPEGTTGCVTPATCAEQMLYEIGDPSAYLLPDVACDFTQVAMTQDGPDRVRVTGTKGHAPTGKLKVSATWADGFRAGLTFLVNGREARTKAQAFAQAGLDRARAALNKMKAPDYREVSFEAFGGKPGEGDYEEISFKAALRHDDARAVGLFLKELTGAALATPPGLHIFTAGGRPRPSPVVALFSFLVPATDLTYRISVDGKVVAFQTPNLPLNQSPGTAPAAPQAPDADSDMIERSLEDLAWARSGDKGDKANIGVIARHPAYLPYIWAALSERVIEARFAEYLQGGIDRYYLPGTHSMNILLHDALGGGGVASLRNDAQGKSYAQILLATPVQIPAGLTVNSNEGGI
ncbi:acyclic terpene utilization AtuA family protein [Tropicibacter sp. Alg240-R139]|uniref:acyclic terpene utilization AtuA family protein n=1 Tax=Tropicibacter sp. Alg240-R139 TaxID=2305991 RepID=UPI0013DFC0F0|nr:acyclic terpene utilization AtuA family protein [Tropicibacter sp. Alg240-R139]